jgi:hypothetical protein
MNNKCMVIVFFGLKRRHGQKKVVLLIGKSSVKEEKWKR